MEKSKIKSRYKNPKVALSMQEVNNVVKICGATALDTRHSVIRTESTVAIKSIVAKNANNSKFTKGIK